MAVASRKQHTSGIVDMLSRMFYNHGHICATHPWEVIVAFLTLTISMISMGAVVPGTKLCTWIYQCSNEQEGKGMDAVVMTIARCMALFYIYHQFRKIYKLGSKYLVGIAGLFTVFSSFVFSSSVVNFLEGNFSELNKALPFFLLLIDLSKAGLLAQFALSSCSQAEVRENIARGMAVLGPSITLDTIVETLVIGVGTLSGVKRLEELCCFACMSAIVNYIVFMTFFPACLSLVLELSKEREEGKPVWQLSSLAKVLQHEQQQKPNPVLQRVKVIMSAGLLLVHAHSRWPLVASSPLDHQSSIMSGSNNKIYLASTNSAWRYTLDRWLTVGSEQMVMLVLACALAVKYVFFESNDELREHLAAVASANSQRNSRPMLHRGTYSSLKHLHRNDSADIMLKRNDTMPSLANGGPKVPTFIIGDDYVVSATKSVDKFSQTYRDEFVEVDNSSQESELASSEIRPLGVCKAILNSEEGPENLTNDEIILLIRSKLLATYKLESILNNPERGVGIRRKLIAADIETNCDFSRLPYRNYDYSLVMGACCENVIGYMPIPVGVAGPLRLDGKNYHVPMATTEGCLIASTNRGCRALSMSGGARSSVVANGMTRGPVIRLPSAMEAAEIMRWLEVRENFDIMKQAFDSTSRFARLKKLHVRIAGRYLFVRFVSETGDAMGMNMLSKGTELSLFELQKFFPNVEILSLSGNYCTDKKPAAVNWIEGRGKSVVCEATIPANVVQDVLKTTVEALVDVNLSKNLIGSAIAGSIGGYNAQAANIVTAIYIATGQDPAQNVSSSNCMTLMEGTGPSSQDLYITCTMPSIEIGTVGGGTVLGPQAACLEMLGVLGCDAENPGENACRLARIVSGTVLAGELSLLSALAAGHLVRSHMKHNRSQLSINLSTSSLGSTAGGLDEKQPRSRNHSNNFLSPNDAVTK